MTMNAEHVLLESVQVASVKARNRIVMAPMVTNSANAKGEVTDLQVAHYATRARGGTGTIIVEASSVARDAKISPRQLGAYHVGFIPGLARCAGAIKDAGAVALLQLCHGGPKSLQSSEFPTVSVSPVGVCEGEVPYALTISQLGEIRREFVAAAVNAQKAGFDGVEIHAAHFYLLSASISAFTNTRTDQYGGAILNRARLTSEIIQEVKSAVGEEYPVWVRINACEAVKSGLSLEEGQEIARIFVEAGADAIHTSAYTLPINKKIAGRMKIDVGAIPLKDTVPGPFLEYASAIRKAVDVPVVAVGKLDDPILASRAVAEGKCDLIALGRQLLCDPYWIKKVEEGRFSDIIRCKYCMTCHTAQQKGERVRCAQNMNLYGEPVYKRSEGNTDKL